MAIIAILETPATADQYDQVEGKLGVANDPPDGLILHTASKIDGGMRVVDCWESEAARDRFGEERLIPALTEVMGPEAMQGPPPVPQITKVHNLVRP